MKCPKCGYIGFDTPDRCRNCGYEFALAVREHSAPVEIEMRSASDTGGPLADLTLTAAPLAGEVRRAGTGKELDLDRLIGVPESPDLPLFEGGTAAPERERRPPASPSLPRTVPVRRGAEAARPRPRNVDEGADVRQNRNLELPLPSRVSPAAPLALEPTPVAAPPKERALAALLDTAMLGGIDLIVVYFTLRLCALSFAELAVLPALPMAAFLLLLNGGYLVVFTAACGQTIGKMAFGLKVIGPDDTSVSLSPATVRAAGALLSAVCLGAGLVPALLGGRALHDRLADTRVVQVAR